MAGMAYTNNTLKKLTFVITIKMSKKLRYFLMSNSYDKLNTYLVLVH